jgi:hypothetical protein
VKPSPIASILLLGGALLVLVSLFTASWFVASHSFGDHDVSFGIGPIRVSSCEDGVCQGSTIFKGRFEAATLVMLLTFVLSLATVGLAIPTGLLLLKPGRRALSIVTVAIGGVAVLLFVIFTIKWGLRGGSGPGLGFILFTLGIAATITGCIMGMVRAPAAMGGMPMRPQMGGYPGYGQQPMPMQGQPMGGHPGMPMQHQQQPPMQQQPMPQPVAAAPAMQQPQQPQAAGAQPCNTCGTPATWVAQYSRWFCQRCNRYL